LVMKSVEEMRRDALDIFRAGLEAVDPYEAVLRHMHRRGESLVVDGRPFDLHSMERVFVVAVGKAAAPMAKAASSVLGPRLTGGVVVVKYGHVLELEGLMLIEAAHPVPDESSLEAARAVLGLLEGTGERDLVLFLLSSGGSALLAAPLSGLSLEDERRLTEELLACGASIWEMNTLRKHLSLTKGGRLAEAAYPSCVVTLVLSDVVGDDLGTIASGPTVPDPTTFEDCLRIVDRYRLGDRLPPRVIELLERGARGLVPETPKAGSPVFDRAYAAVVGSNLQAALTACGRARSLGYNAMVLSSLIEGDTREAARFHTAVARETARSSNPLAPPACIVSGGETTVVVRGPGKGGRNQEFVLAAAMEIAGMEGVVVLSAGTDGTDGPTDAAGAVADGRSCRRAGALGMDAARYLERNDSYNFFRALGDLVVTGPTLTNVMDLRVVLVGGKSPPQVG